MNRYNRTINGYKLEVIRESDGYYAAKLTKRRYSLQRRMEQQGHGVADCAADARRADCKDSELAPPRGR